MRFAIFLLIAGLSAGCATKSATRAAAPPPQLAASPQKAEASDPIDQFVASIGQGLNGFWQGLDLPPTASPEEVVKQALEENRPNIGQVTRCEILIVRQVHFTGWNILYTAAYVQTNVGKKIVLFTNQGPKVKWQSRVYNR